VTQHEPKHIKGDGVTTPDLKLFVGAYITVTYWQADPQNNRQSTIYIKNDRQPGEVSLVVYPNQAAQLADVLSFISRQVD